MKLYRLYDIRWDTSSDSDELADVPSDPKELGLPTHYFTVQEDDFDPAEESCDVLSDKFGYCIFGCSFEELTIEECCQRFLN